MPALSNDPKTTLTYGEHRKKLLEKFEENPDDLDPEVQKLKKEYQEVYQGVINNLTPQVEYLNKDVLPNITRILESPWFTKSMRDTTDLINSFSEPLKALTEAIAKVKTPILYTQLDVLRVHPVINVFPQPTVKIEHSEDLKELIKEERRSLNAEVAKVKEIDPRTLNWPYFYYEDTNSMVLIHTQVIAINFGSSSGNDNISTLMKVFMKSLKERGKEKDGFVEIGLKVAEIIEGLKHFGIVEVTGRWISNTKNNLLNKKIPAIAKGLVTISDYDKDLDGYYLRVRLTPEIPLIN